MLTTEQTFKVLRDKGKELSDWLRDSFDHYAKIVITSSSVTIIEELNKPNKEHL